MNRRQFTIGARGSKLALWQARWTEARLRELGFAASVQVIKTTGDKISAAPLAEVAAGAGLKGVFTKEIEEALLDGRIDLAVHSLKDLPTELDGRLEIGCIPKRADPRDALVGKKLAELGPGDRVGTGSLRRSAQFKQLKPDVAIEGIRGNVDTRLRKLAEGRYDAVLLAAAGLRRLGLEACIAEILEPDIMAPAVGQGALAIEIRAGDERARTALTPLRHRETAAAVTAERALLHAFGGGCQVPLGAYGRVAAGRLILDAAGVSTSGCTIRASAEGRIDEARTVGATAAAKLRELGAAL